MLEMSEQSGKSRLARRAFLATSGAGLAGLAFWLATPHPGEAAGPAMVSIVMFSNAGVRERVVSLPKVVKSDAGWRKQLGYDSFEVTRHGDTERPFTGALLNEHKKGIFCCICCDTAVFSSDTKFESGTGWPSFWAPIAKENIVETTDAGFGMIRTAISCRLCDAHLGHVFNDGPKPTGLRYCMNSVALKFAKARVSRLEPSWRGAYSDRQHRSQACLGIAARPKRYSWPDVAQLRNAGRVRYTTHRIALRGTAARRSRP